MSLLGLSLQRIDSGLIQADIVDQVLHNTEDVLVLIGKGHLKRVIEGCSTASSSCSARRYRWFTPLCIDLLALLCCYSFFVRWWLHLEWPLRSRQLAWAILLPDLGRVTSVQLIQIKAVHVAVLLIRVHFCENGVHHLGQGCLCRIPIDLRVRRQMYRILCLEGFH